MKKTRGKKKKINSSKKVNNFFIFKSKVAPVALVSIAVIVLSILVLLVFNHPTGNTISGDATLSLTDSPPQVILNFTNFLNLGNTWRDLILSVVVLLIIFAGLFDIIQLTSLFTNQWVMYIIAGGLSLIACLTSAVYNIVTFFLQVAAGAGAIGIAVEVIIAVIIFIGLSFGSTRIAMWAAKRQAQKAMIQTRVAAGDAAAAVRGLRDIETEFKRK
jgi:hypothetical protein